MADTVWIPADRFIALLDKCAVTNQDLDIAGTRRVFDLRNGRQEAISLDAVDRILTKLNLTDWFHLPKEMGGLSDLYFGEEVFTPSWAITARAQLEAVRSSRKKYATMEEARAANREKSRRSARRLGKRCQCGTPITNRAQSCHPCYVARITPAAHGTNSRYASRTHRCRCDLCKAASARYHRDRRRRMRAAYLDAQRRAA